MAHVKTGGVTMIPIDGGKYHVWTKCVGTGAIQMLTLHGGPGCTHEYMECFEDFLPQRGIQFHYYDQLGSHYSDQPDDPSLWTVARFCDEVEQVRAALGLENFYLFGHSWGGMLGIEYALKHQAVGDNGAALRDAVRYGIKTLQNQPAQFRRIILLLSQEEDAGSQSRLADVVRDLARSGTTIYSFTFSSDGTRRKSHKTKPQRRNVGDLPPSPDAVELAEESGGENIRFSGEDDLEQKISVVREEIRSGYILSFRPSAPTPGLHKIKVEVVGQNGRLKVLARKNYWLDDPLQ